MRRDPVFWLSAAALGIILLAAVFAERLAPFGPNEQDITKRLQAPGLASSHILGPSRSPPNNMRPRNPPSRANANTPSAASRLPNTLPTKREYCDQFIPNANSWTRPVAMPSANTSP